MRPSPLSKRTTRRKMKLNDDTHSNAMIDQLTMSTWYSWKSRRKKRSQELPPSAMQVNDGYRRFQRDPQFSSQKHHNHATYNARFKTCHLVWVNESCQFSFSGREAVPMSASDSIVHRTRSFASKDLRSFRIGDCITRKCFSFGIIFRTSRRR